MKSKTQTLGKKILVGGATLAMAGSMLATGIVAPFGASAWSSANGKWYSDFNNHAEATAFAEQIAVQIEAESMVLMKNNGVLPLTKGVKNVSLFGARSYSPVTGGTGSGGGGGSYYTLPQSLENAGYKINPALQTVYANNQVQAMVTAGMWGGRSNILVDPDASVLEEAEYSYIMYGDAAIFTIGRSGGEGSDLLTLDLPTHSDPYDHVLSLDDNEKAALEYIKSKFSKVIVLVNCANVMELGELENDEEIDAILWIGQPGNHGLEAVGQVLNGNVNPSGRTVDIYTRNHKLDPTWQNFGLMDYLNDYGDLGHGEIYGSNGSMTSAASSIMNNGYNTAIKSTTDNTTYTTVSGTVGTLEYEEGIYLGYKYYETVAADMATGGEEWYDQQIVYPFGYGLSYTTFEKEIVTKAADLEAAINAAQGLDDKVEVQVKVTNTGNVAGKEVAQLYVHAPYTAGGIEKAEVSFLSFDKTDLLSPGESQVLTLKVRMGDIASFDYNDANNNNYKGWEIEAGNYQIRLQNNSHDVEGALNVALTAKSTTLDNDADKANNTPLSNGDDYDSLLNLKEADSKSTMKIMSRKTDMTAAGNFPTPTTNAERVYGAKISALAVNNGNTQTTDRYARYTAYYNSSDDLPTDPWYKTNDDIPATWTQAADTTGREGGKTAVQLKEMAGTDYWSNEPVKEGNPYYVEGAATQMTEKEAWDQFMNQLTYQEMATLLSNGSYQTPGLASIGKDSAVDQDGPANIRGGTNWPCEVNISSTYNIELAKAQGRCVGEESLYLDIPGWYAPAMNIHRSAFSGRNFEYYSQDATQGGIIAAAVCFGAESKGCYVYIKHFGLNDQETNRMGTCTWADEQTIRENYFKNFEYAVKDGGASAVMTAFNRVGAINEFANYMTLQQIMRYEWGFKGQAVTDYYSSNQGKANYLMRGGCELPLGRFSGSNSITGTWDASLRGGKGGVRDGDAVGGVVPESPTQYWTLRDCATRVCWVGANTNVNTNCLDTSAFANTTLTAGRVGQSYNQTISVNTATLGTTDVTYAVTSGELPAGLTLSNGRISGTPREAGTFRVTVTMTADKWITRSATFTLTIAPSATGVTGESFSTPVTFYEVGDIYGTNSAQVITRVETTSMVIPEGFTLANGQLTGTFTAPGLYTYDISQTVTYRRNATSTQTRTATVSVFGVIEVTGDAITPEDTAIQFRVNEGILEYKVGTEGTWTAATAGITTSEVANISVTKEGTTTTVTVSYMDGRDPITFTIEDVVADETPAQGGCGGIIGVSSAIAATVVLGAAAFVLRKKD